MSDSPKHALQGLYGITDSKLMPDDETMAVRVKAAIAGGMSILQYRDKSTDQDKRLRQARLLMDICDSAGVLFLINDDVDLALACNAHGVHLGQSDEQLASAREKLGSKAIIGISCENSLELARKASGQGADYIAFGRFFTSKTKPDAPETPVSILQDAKEQFALPVVAIGGITVENAGLLIEAGADSLAVINDLFARDEPEAITSRAQDFVNLYN
ncbi:thiamine phosphate synthase [Sansalvadorimonas sp. 2012CJ34-2]|uniref:Thiamine-phosphate synthase n=1 Tax=Parendozoicomonas callyspongiae TaxID=2942213 RepID=A0ABT0PGC8_9GAMM|nr:thiamine phosphate synthase [Sansalvadorimonas sp. 2012CJ34-2]MCL6270440.1 thiamine phosphate synthase [Sansalvadorimonas sp. 2012CJ34-2]